MKSNVSSSSALSAAYGLAVTHDSDLSIDGRATEQCAITFYSLKTKDNKLRKDTNTHTYCGREEGQTQLTSLCHSRFNHCSPVITFNTLLMTCCFFCLACQTTKGTSKSYLNVVS